MEGRIVGGGKKEGEVEGWRKEVAMDEGGIGRGERLSFRVKLVDRNAQSPTAHHRMYSPYQGKMVHVKPPCLTA